VFVAIVLQAIPFLVLGTLLSAAIAAFVSPEAVARLVPRRRLWAVPIAGLAGAALPTCECTPLPNRCPIRRGVGVYQQYLGHASGHHVALRVLGNKIADETDVAYLRGEIGSELIGCLTQSAWVRGAERGEPRPITELEPGNRAVLDTIRTELDTQRRDWAAYHRGTVEFHRRKAQAWANRATGADLMTQVDPDFLLGPAVVASRT
jgi:Predicted permease